MANELMLINNIEKNLRKRNEIEVFPLTPTHRKELRQLKATNVGNLRERIRAIKKLKRDEYAMKYKKMLETQLKEKEKLVDSLNSNWKYCLKTISVILTDRKKLEESSDMTYLNVDTGYNILSQLNADRILTDSDYSRDITLPTERTRNDMLKEQFDEKYGKAFEEANEHIDDMETKYEEAINFGNLEIVKELYYLMKGADSFFDKIQKLKI